MGPWRRLAPPPMSRAPSLIRMEAARAARYGAQWRRSEDTDFLLRALWDGFYAVLPEVAYVYSEWASVAPEKLLAGYGYRGPNVLGLSPAAPGCGFRQRGAGACETNGLSHRPGGRPGGPARCQALEGTQPGGVPDGSGWPGMQLGRSRTPSSRRGGQSEPLWPNCPRPARAAAIRTHVPESWRR